MKHEYQLKRSVLMFGKSRKHPEANPLTFYDLFVGTMFVIIVGIMPLIVRYAMRPMPPELVTLMESEIFHDLFSYWKGVFLSVPTGIIVLYTISDVATSKNMPDFKKLFMRPQVYFSAVFLLFVFVSAMLSEYRFTSWWGTFERSEGAFMWLVYIAAFIAAMLFVRNMKHAWFILGGLIFSSIIMGTIGIGQMIGRDFFATDLSKTLILLGTGMSDYVEEISPVFDIANATLYNPNTFGKYSAMLGPMLLIIAITYRGRLIVNALLFVGGFAMLGSVFASGSLGGAVGILAVAGVLFVTLVVRLFVIRKNLKIDKRIPIAVLALILAFFVMAATVPQLRIGIDRNFARFEEMLMFEGLGATFDYRVERNELMVLRGESMVMRMVVDSFDEVDWIRVYDHAGNAVELSERTPVGFADDPQIRYVYNVYGYRAVVITRHLDHFTVDLGGMAPLFLMLHSDRLFGVMPGLIIIDFAEEIPAWGFYGRERWGSNRGYIWSRAFPLMPRTAIIGTGPDTFLSVFPQQDVLGKLRFYHNPHIIVDKAHNIFIQTWITSGGISAIALFALFGHFAFTTFIDLARAKKMPISLFGLRLGILCAVSAFVVSGMATDSTIGSTGVFFVILGMGYALQSFESHIQSA